MTYDEQAIITRFANGEKDFRDEAIRIHRTAIRLHGLRRGDPFFDFMSEIDNPAPDLVLRWRYRQLVLATDIKSTPEK